MLVPGVLFLEGVHPEAATESVLTPWLRRAGERLQQASEAEMPEIAAWRRAYSQMGLKPTKYRSAAEALLRRFKREGDIPRLHPLIDLCNALSLAFALPVAVFDVDNVKDYIEVCHARGDEDHLAFSGETEAPAPGEVIFADAAHHAHARRWTFRQSRRSTVTPETRRVLIVSEALHETAEADIESLMETLTGIVSELWSPPRAQARLTAESPCLDFGGRDRLG